MEVCKGSARIAFKGEKYTVKVPNPDTFLQSYLSFKNAVRDTIKRHRFKRLYAWLTQSENALLPGLLWAVNGIKQNRREAKLSKTINSGVVVPTRMSIIRHLKCARYCKRPLKFYNKPRHSPTV